MSPGQRYEVLWTETAVQMLTGVSDRRIQQQLFDVSKRLQHEPEKQGKPLREDLLGYRSLRVAGQRYRLVDSIDSEASRVHVVAAGLRRAGAREDVYELAQKMVRLGLAAGPPKTNREVSRVGRQRKKR